MGPFSLSGIGSTGRPIADIERRLQPRERSRRQMEVLSGGRRLLGVVRHRCRSVSRLSGVLGDWFPGCFPVSTPFQPSRRIFVSSTSGVSGDWCRASCRYPTSSSSCGPPRPARCGAPERLRAKTGSDRSREYVSASARGPAGGRRGVIRPRGRIVLRNTGDRVIPVEASAT